MKVRNAVERSLHFVSEYTRYLHSCSLPVQSDRTPRLFSIFCIVWYVSFNKFVSMPLTSAGLAAPAIYSDGRHQTCTPACTRTSVSLDSTSESHFPRRIQGPHRAIPRSVSARFNHPALQQPGSEPTTTTSKFTVNNWFTRGTGICRWDHEW
jgi:hypothetical protein